MIKEEEGKGKERKEKEGGWWVNVGVRVRSAAK